ncbi:MAG: glutamate racemase [Oscillospiraceae bacterium]|nr:glutamate racemase [Oscillospiraceae bacterium]
MDNRPIGIFDSGLGGLTGMKALLELLPDENIIYFADSGRNPYGSRTREQVRRMAEQNLRFVSSFGVKAILVACGTVSSNAADLLERWPVPTAGVLLPTADYIGRLPGRAPVAVAATAASIRSGSYQRALQDLCPGREIVAAACPDFVPLIESGHCSAGDPLVQDAVARCLRPAKEAGAEILLLGCTHYGLISDAISAYLGTSVSLVSAAECGAAALCGRLLRSRSTGGSRERRFFTSGSTDAFNAAAVQILGEEANIKAEYVPPLPV